MNSPLRALLLLGLVTPTCALLFAASRAQDELPPLPHPAVGGTRGPSALLFSADGSRLYVAEQDESAVAVLDGTTRQSLAIIPTGGLEPLAEALTPDGKGLVVANSIGGSLAFIDIEKRALEATMRLAGMPYGVAVSPAREAFVSLNELDQVAVIDLNTRRIKTRISVGKRPRSLLLLPDQHTVVCANFGDGTLSLIDVGSYSVRASVPVGAINLRGITSNDDGTEVWVTAQRPHNDRPTVDPEGLWDNLVCGMNVRSHRIDRVIPLDAPGHGAADPTGIALDTEGKRAWVALAGVHEVAAVSLSVPAPSSNHQTGSLTAPPDMEKSGVSILRFPVGANPRAVSRRPRSAEIWAGNHLGNSLSVLDAAATTKTGLATGIHIDVVDLGLASPSPNRRLKGRFLFTSAHLTRGERFSCETCHPDLGVDGLSWKFAHVHDGLDERNTRELRGSLLLTGPYGWSGREQDFENFVNTEIVGLLHTHRLVHEDVHAFWDLVNETSLPPNPFRDAEGKLTSTALRGQALFRGSAGCIACHRGDQHGGVDAPQWIGTTPEGIKLDVPHLVGVYGTAPYLHDGRAATFADIFQKFDPDHLHGKTEGLTTAQFNDLMEYLREL